MAKAAKAENDHNRTQVLPGSFVIDRHSALRGPDSQKLYLIKSKTKERGIPVLQFFRDKYMRILVLEVFTRRNDMISGLIMRSENSAELYQCATVEEAVRLMLSHEIDLFVIGLHSDKRTGDMDGLRFLRCIRKTERYFDAYVIVISDLIDKELIAYKDYHCYKFYEYPFDRDEFKEDIRELTLKCGLGDMRERERRNGYIHLAIEDSFYKVRKDNILMIEVHSKHDVVYLKDIGEISLPKRELKKLIGHLDNSEMLYCNRSNIVNMRNVERIDRKKKTITLVECDKEISITELGRKNLRKYMEYWCLKS